ncbi:MAG: hypothetical protein HYS56_02190, partial [Candidatus Omnitrophica bacterium]|nr:hypothetical protein [Candidatus Omnitrophota bacterium]
MPRQKIRAGASRKFRSPRWLILITVYLLCERFVITDQFKGFIRCVKTIREVNAFFSQFLHKYLMLPGRYSDSGLLWHFTALVTEQGKWNHRIISIVREGQTPDQARRIRPKPPKTYRNPIFRAKEYARMIESGQAKNESDLARKVGISRVRIWQYTSLLGLNASLV